MDFLKLRVFDDYCLCLRTFLSTFLHEHSFEHFFWALFSTFFFSLFLGACLKDFPPLFGAHNLGQLRPGQCPKKIIGRSVPMSLLFWSLGEICVTECLAIKWSPVWKNFKKSKECQYCEIWVNLCGRVSGGHEMDPSFAFGRQTRSHILRLLMMQNGIF